LLDFDRAAQAEAALELAKLDVRLELHLRQNLMAPERHLMAYTKVLTTAEKLYVNPCGSTPLRTPSGSVWPVLRTLTAA
jgi:hypothetical protein